MHEVSDPIFIRKNKKNISKCSLVNFLPNTDSETWNKIKYTGKIMLNKHRECQI